MGKSTINVEKTRAYIKALGNPYASLSIYGEGDESVKCSTSAKKVRQYLNNSQNPYAVLGLYEESGPEMPSVKKKVQPVQPVPEGKLSKKDFQTKCRRILMQYVPAEERRVLRSHHRDFVTRNESRSAEDRFLLVHHLSKYDLSNTGNYLPHFNRERDPLTVKKLKEIEKKIDS